MKKFMVFTFVSVIFVSCDVSVGNDYKLPEVSGKSIFHSIFYSSDKNDTDSAKAANDKRFNFFFKEGISKKFGL